VDSKFQVGVEDTGDVISGFAYRAFGLRTVVLNLLNPDEGLAHASMMFFTLDNDNADTELTYLGRVYTVLAETPTLNTTT